MIPVLFKKDEQQFRTYGLGEITDIINPKVTRERNGQYLLYFQYPQNAEFSDVFEEEMRIKADAGVRTKWQTFEISRVIRKEGQLIEVFAKHISQSLLKDALNPDVNIRTSTAEQALRIWNNNRIGDEAFDVTSDITTTNSTSWHISDVSNAFEALAGVEGSILDVWGGEYEFDNKTIRLHKEMGRKSTVPLEYGRNITGLEQDQQDDNVYTSIYPFATYIPDSETGERSEPRTVTLPERYVDGKYLEMHNKRKIQVVDFSAEFDYDNQPTVSRLRSLANQYSNANEVGLPHENLMVEYIDLSKTLDYQEFQVMEEVELNDRLPIFYPKFGVTNENAKVVVVDYDPVKEENISIELGVIGQSFRTITTGGIGSRLDRIEKQQVETMGYIVNAQGNRIWFETPDENMEHKVGDTWFEKNGPYDRIRVWNGSQWETIIDSEDIDKNAKAIEEQQQEIEEAKQQAIDSKQEAIDEAERLVEEQDIIYQELFDGYDAAVDDLTEGIGVADQKAIKALEKAGESENLARAASKGVERVEQNLTAVNNKTDDALSKADNALVKANNIPATIDNVITDKGLVSGDWVNTRINEETGEINYQLESVKGDVPDVIMGVEWDKTSDPTMMRTDYVEEFANLDDYELQSAEFRVSVEGLGMDLADVKRDKLDSGVFTSFKTNEYTNDINGIRQRLTSAEENKLDDSKFQDFREHEYQVSVDGLVGDIQKLERKKLDEVEFTSFKSNEYQLTVDGFDMALTSVSGAIPDYVFGVEWNRTENPRMERTDYMEEIDLTNYDAPDYIMGVEWDGESDPTMFRAADTEETTSRREFEVFLGDYNFNAEGWNATNTYVNNNKTQINSLISNASGWQQTISYVDENQVKFNETISQVDSYKQTIGNNGEKITQLVMTDDAFITKVGELEGATEDFVVGVEWERTSSPEMARTGYMDDWTETQVAQLSDSWVLNIKSGLDIKTQINATADGLRFKGDLIHIESERTLIDNAVIKSAHIDTLNVSKLTGTTAEFTTLRSKIITANVIKSTHIETSVALVDKIFADTAQINRLTSKTAFINNVKAIEISADRIITGELNGANVRIVNLDFNTAVGNRTEFVQSAWNNAVGGNVSISGGGIRTTASDGSQGLIQNGVFLARRPESGSTVGYIGYDQSNGPSFQVTTTLGAHFKVRNHLGDGRYQELFALESGGITARFSVEQVIFDGNRGRFQAYEFNNRWGGGMYATTGYITRIYSGQNLEFMTNGKNHADRKMMLDNTRIYMYNPLNMGGRQILESPSISDARMKDVQGLRNENDLEKLMRIEYVNFRWLSEEYGGQDLGFIAQQVQIVVPEIMMKSADGFLGYNQQTYLNFIGHSVQQLASRERNTNKKATQALRLSESNEQKIKRLEDEVKELRGMVA